MSDLRQVDTPQYEGVRVLIRPATPEDYPFIYQVEMHPEHLHTWRHAGHTPPPDEVPRALWKGAQVVLMTVMKHDPRVRVGYNVLYNVSPGNAHADVAVIAHPQFNRTSLGMEGAALFLDYIFRNWSFRKLYAESAEYNASAFASGLKWLLEEEGRLKGHFFYDGDFYDKLIFAIYRERWYEKRHVLRALFDRPVEILKH